MVIAFESCFHHCREIAALVPCLIDRDAEWSQSWQIHQQVVNQIAEPRIEVASYDSSQSHTIGTTQGVIGHDGIEPSVVFGWQIFHSLHLKGHLQILYTSFHPRSADFVALLPEKGVHLILVRNALEPRNKWTGNPISFGAHLVFEYLINVNGL